MRAVRWGLGLLGVAAGLWGIWIYRDVESDRLISALVWLVGGIVVHDAVLAPLVVGLGVLAARWLPGSARRPAAAVFIVWSTVTVSAAAVLSGQGGKPDNSTILERPYVLSWLLLSGLCLAVALAWTRRVASRPTPDRAVS